MLFLVCVKDNDLDDIPHREYLAWVADEFIADTGDVHETVDAAEVEKGIKGLL